MVSKFPQNMLFRTCEDFFQHSLTYATSSHEYNAVTGALIYVDPDSGEVTGYDDVFTKLAKGEGMVRRVRAGERLRRAVHSVAQDVALSWLYKITPFSQQCMLFMALRVWHAPFANAVTYHRVHVASASRNVMIHTETTIVS